MGIEPEKFECQRNGERLSFDQNGYEQEAKCTRYKEKSPNVEGMEMKVGEPGRKDE